MPGLDGYGVIAALRADTETVTIPFIFLTANAEKLDIRSQSIGCFPLSVQIARSNARNLKFKVFKTILPQNSRQRRCCGVRHRTG
jgi:CheY-like chemotaxis protein